MKIMIVLSGLQGGGAERVSVVWADAFVRLGHEVVLATNKSAEDAPFVYPVNPKVHLANCFSHSLVKDSEKDLRLRRRYGLIYRIFRSTYFYVKTHIDLRREMKRFHPDVVLGVLNPTSLQALIASIGLGCPVVATEHNSFERPEYAAFTRSQRFFKFKSNKWFPLVSVLTTADKEFIGSRLKNVTVMPNPLALQPIDTPSTHKQKRIVAAGRLGAWHVKGFDILIDAWSRIAKKYPDWTVDIAGCGDEKSTAYLQGLINKGGISSQCVLSGFHSDVATLYADSEIFVLSSRYEGFGMVLIEAMSQGCACVAADYKGRQYEIMPSDDIGLCVPPDDAVALASAIERVISDESLRHRMQQKAIERSRDYDSLIIGHKWEEELKQVVNK